MVGIVVRAQILPGPGRPLGRIRDRVEFMISQHHSCVAGVDHRLDDLQHPQLIGPPVDQIADEHRRPLRVPVGPVVRGVVHLRQQRLEVVGAAVDIADHVITGHCYLLCRDGMPTAAHRRNRRAGLESDLRISRASDMSDDPPGTLSRCPSC